MVHAPARVAGATGPLVRAAPGTLSVGDGFGAVFCGDFLDASGQPFDRFVPGDLLLSLRVFADNAAAVRSYEKAGFHREALLQDEIRNEDGSWRDLILMAVLFPESSESMEK